MPPKKRKRTQRTKSRPAPKNESRQLKVLLASLCLIGFLLASLVFLSYLRQSLRPEPVSKVETGQYILEDLRVELESALLRSGIALAQIKSGQKNDVATFEVNSPFPASDVLGALSERVQRLSPNARVDWESASDSIVVYLGDRIVYQVRFVPPPVEPLPYQPPLTEPLPPPLPQTSLGRMAIIMDDLGQDMRTAKTLLDIDLAVTLAIIPQNEQAPRVAALAHKRGREVMVHIPMEPQGYPAVNPGSDALLVKQSPEEIRQRFQGYLKRVPHAVGGNNHMGSEFTQDKEKMAVVIEEIRKAGMFFVDSRTSSHSVAFEMARDAGVPATTRDVFLDNVQDEDLIAREIHKLVRMALKTGQAVGICHPHPQTLAALRREAGYIRSQGVEVVPVSQLLVR